MPAMSAAELPHTIQRTPQSIQYSTSYDWYGPMSGAQGSGIAACVTPINPLEVATTVGGFPKRYYLIFVGPDETFAKDDVITWTDPTPDEVMRVDNEPQLYYDPSVWPVVDGHHIEFVAIVEQ